MPKELGHYEGNDTYVSISYIDTDQNVTLIPEAKNNIDWSPIDNLKMQHSTG